MAQELKGVGVGQYEMPEWKKEALGKAPQFGIRQTKSIAEQRKSLPVYKLRDQLIQAILENQVLQFKM